PFCPVRSRWPGWTKREKRDQDTEGANACRTKAIPGRQGLPGLPAGLQGPDNRAGFRWVDVRLQLLLRRRRHVNRWPAARQTWRYNSGPRRRLQISSGILRRSDEISVYLERSLRERHGAVRGNLLPHSQRHAGEADRDQSGGRRRGGIRW